MLVLLTVRLKCTLSASHNVPTGSQWIH